MPKTITFTDSQAMALTSILGEALAGQEHAEVYHDVVNDADTTAADLFQLVMNPPINSDADSNVLWHQSGVNQKGEPFVQLIKDQAVIAQLDMEMAREHGHAMLEAAEAAEQDAFIMSFFQGELGTSFEQAGAVLVRFREQRAARTNKRGGPTNPRDWVMPPKKSDG